MSGRRKVYGRDERKQTYWLRVTMIEEAKAEGARLGLSLSAVMQLAWKMAKVRFENTPALRIVPIQRSAA